MNKYDIRYGMGDCPQYDNIYTNITRMCIYADRLFSELKLSFLHYRTPRLHKNVNINFNYLLTNIYIYIYNE